MMNNSLRIFGVDRVQLKKSTKCKTFYKCFQYKKKNYIRFVHWAVCSKIRYSRFIYPGFSEGNCLSCVTHNIKEEN